MNLIFISSLHITNLKILQYSEPQEFSLQTYIDCLKYTITFKLAPFWNLMGKSNYIKEFNFLSMNNVEGVSWDISIKGNMLINLKI